MRKPLNGQKRQVGVILDGPADRTLRDLISERVLRGEEGSASAAVRQLLHEAGRKREHREKPQATS